MPSPYAVEVETGDGTSRLVSGETFVRLVGEVVETLTATSLTLTDEYHGKLINTTSGSATTITVPAGLRRDFQCQIRQGGAGQVTVTASGTTINNSDSQTKTAGQYASVWLTGLSLNTYDLYGKTGA